VPRFTSVLFLIDEKIKEIFYIPDHLVSSVVGDTVQRCAWFVAGWIGLGCSAGW